MSILVDKNTRLVVQGMTGSVGQFHTEQMLAYGTKVVAGCTPGRGGQSLMDVPVFDTMREVVKQTGANASCVFVPPPFAADAILEAMDAEIPAGRLHHRGHPRDGHDQSSTSSRFAG